MSAPREIEWWLPVPGSETTEVSSLGRARRFARYTSDGELVRTWRPRLVMPSVCGGYLRIGVHYGKRVARTEFLHRVVLMTWIGKPGFLDQACHFPDADSSNCRLSNLRWATKSENGLDSAAMNRGPNAVAARLAMLQLAHAHLSAQANGGVLVQRKLRDIDLSFYTDDSVAVDGFSPEAIAC